MDLATKTNYDKTDDLTNFVQAVWRENIHGFINGTKQGAGMDFSNEAASLGFWKYTRYNKFQQPEEEPILDGSVINVWKVGYVFAGWYDNKEFTGDAITEIPENLIGVYNLYARWVEES